MRRAVLIAQLAGCFTPAAQLGIPCGPDGECPQGQVCTTALTCELQQLAPDAPDADPIDAQRPFGAPFQIVIGSGGTFDDDPSLRGDELEIVFASDRSGGQGDCDLWTAKRASLDVAFGSPTNLGPAINSNSCDAGGELSVDGLTLYFASKRNGTWDIFVSHRATLSSPWDAAAAVPELSSPAIDEKGPSLAADGLTLAFYSGAGNSDLWWTTRATTAGAWSPPTRIDELSTQFDEESPHLSTDGLQLWFVTNRIGDDFDLWVARRPTKTSRWNVPTRVDELSAPGEDDDPWVSADGQRIYYAHGVNGNRLYGAVRQ
jgi:WD40-like Beta Propeller Repeat